VSTEKLNKDQIHRVSEIANQATWSTLFTQGTGDRETQFEPADASKVLEGMSEEPRKVSEIPSDYLNDPPGERAPSDIDLKSAFGILEDDEKEDYPKLNPTRDEEVKLEKAASAEQLARHGADLLLPELHSVGEKFYSLVKQACLNDDHSILQISQAVGSVTESEKFAESVMQTSVDKLVAEGVKIDVRNELRKTASKVVINTSHPLLETAVKFEKLATAYTRSVKAMDRLSDARKRAEADFKSSARSN